jgi:hypothetical protein
MLSRAFLPSLVACFALGRSACSIGSDTVDPYTKCAVQAVDQNWVTAGMDVDVNLPDHCPFGIPAYLTIHQDYYGIATGNSQYIGSVQYVPFNYESRASIRVFNANSPPQLQNDNQAVPKFSFTGSPPRADLRVGYTAGTYTNPFDHGGADYGFMDVLFKDQQTQGQGRAKLSFTYNVSAVVTGPSSIIGGSSISLGSQASNYRTPLTYKWWKNGTLMSGVTWPSFSTQGPAAGSSVTYKLEITDADGDKGTDSHTITGGSSGGGTGGGGGGCLVTKLPTPTSGKEKRDSSTMTANPCPS